MTLLDRYIAWEIGKAFFLVMLALVSLFSFLDLIQQVDDVGTGSYGFLDALLFELRMLGPRAIDLLPFGALMGTATALSLLASHGEVIAIQAAGISVARFAWAVMKSAIPMVLVAMLIQELAVSRLHQEAVRQRSLALSDTEVTQAGGGFWIHHGERFIHIDRVQHGSIPADIDILELDGERRVSLYIHAKQALVADPTKWLLIDVVVKRLGRETVSSERVPWMHWDSYMTSEEIGLLELPPQTMSLRELLAYVGYLKEAGQQTDRYEINLWHKLTLPIAVVALVLLAVPSAFGSPRSATAGRRIIAALAAGLAFQIGSQIAANLGLLLELPPGLSSLAMPFVAVVAALVLFRRVLP
jgi:lipopolysaccharide export system permease protein